MKYLKKTSLVFLFLVLSCTNKTSIHKLEFDNWNSMISELSNEIKVDKTSIDEIIVIVTKPTNCAICIEELAYWNAYSDPKRKAILLFYSEKEKEFLIFKNAFGSNMLIHWVDSELFKDHFSKDVYFYRVLLDLVNRSAYISYGIDQNSFNQFLKLIVSDK